MQLSWIASIAALLLCACSSPKEETEGAAESAGVMRLEILAPERSGIHFKNNMVEDDSANFFTYLNIYNGGGVAAGDIDGDSLPDLVFVSNRSGGAVYKNLGGLRFQDVTATSGFNLGAAWATGVCMADVNADGHMDVYVCASGPATRPESTRRNLLFINDGKGRFTQQAAAFGLDRTGHTTMAYFADLDGDVDLDLFLVGHRNDFHLLRQLIIDPRFLPVHDQSDRLYINEGNGHFTDRSVESGVSSRNYGLAAVIGDVNADGRNDIYVCNDFSSTDQMLMNTGNDPATGVPLFRDEVLQQFRHISYNSMGADMADFNNDGLRDLCVVDMTPADHKLNKENMASMNPTQFGVLVNNGFHHQYMVNTLQLNNGNGTWSEVGQMAGVDRTDWSWTPLFCDLDNDGWKDLFVANGIARDINNSDFRAEVARIAEEQGTEQDFRPILDLAPAHAMEKMVFRNKGLDSSGQASLVFEKAMDSWDFHHLGASNGALWSDLDRDGDLDLVTVDANAPSRVVKNHARENNVGHFLQLCLKGGPKDPSATGASVVLYSKGSKQLSDLIPARGFQGSVEPLIHFGVGDATIDSVVISWPDGMATTVVAPQRDQRLFVDRNKAAVHAPFRKQVPEPLFADVAAEHGIRAVHAESKFDDFATESLLPQAQSQHGPCVAVADVNGDGTDDVFLGSPVGTPCALFYQTPDGAFVYAGPQGWDRFNRSEFIGAHFFDADGDRDPDIYLAAGSTEYPAGSEHYQDRLFLNDGRGHFSYADGAVPTLTTSTMCVASNDLDGDGDLDLFVGGRNVPGAWPAPPKSHVLINDHGRFADASATWLAGNESPGLLTGAVFADVDGDKRDELVVCGEWMPIGVWKNTNGAFKDVAATMLDTALTGWWQSITVADLDGDGDNDLLAGNLGLNNKFHPSKEKPLKVYMSDLDGSGTNDIVLAKCGAQGELPVRGRECSSGQMPFILEKFPTYKAFANATLEGIYGAEKLGSAVQLKATTFASMYFINQGGRFVATPLPMAAQVSPVRGALVGEMTGDGKPDMILVGNMFGTEVETARYDGGMGLLLLGNGHGGFDPVAAVRSGISIPYDTRHIATLTLAGQKAMMVVNNNGPIQLFVPRAQVNSRMLTAR